MSLNTTVTALSNLEQVQNKIEQLKQMLAANAPGYESMLHTIHVALHQDESLSHLLKEEEIGVIIAGLSKKKNIVIATSTAKSKTIKGKSLKDITLDDI